MHNSGKVIWSCGLSGAGRSTLAHAAVDLIRARGQPVVLFDRNKLRNIFDATEDTEKNHGRDPRLALAMTYAKLCHMVADQRINVVIVTISLFREVHTWNRAHNANYFEIYLKVPFEELRRPDPKSIYLRFDAGDITNVAGMDIPVDEPEAPDWTVEFKPSQSVDFIAEELMKLLKRQKINDNKLGLH